MLLFQSDKAKLFVEILKESSNLDNSNFSLPNVCSRANMYMRSNANLISLHTYILQNNPSESKSLGANIKSIFLIYVLLWKKTIHAVLVFCFLAQTLKPLYLIPNVCKMSLSILKFLFMLLNADSNVTMRV